MKAFEKQVARQNNRRTIATLGTLLVVFLVCGLAGAQKWIPVTTPQFPVGQALQLTDGTIMVQENKTSNWWLLHPDKFGHYNTGSWTALPPMPAGYAPTYFASAVLPDGRAIIEGGEYNNGVEDWTNLGAIYSPYTNSWTKVNPPPGWSKIGDAPSVVLPDGTFMLGNCCAEEAALLDPTTLTWTVLTTASGYKGKFDNNNEEGWTMLPGFNGDVLTVDTHGPDTSTHSEVYNWSSGNWTNAGSTVQQLWDSRLDCGGTKSTHEIGPAVLRPDGTVFAAGANTCPGFAGHTAIYSTKTGLWTAGPDILGGNDAADAPASILPDGNVLLATNPGWGKSPISFYEFQYSGAGWTSITPPSGLNPSNTEGDRMLVTSQGTVLLVHVESFNLWIYKPLGTYQNAWRPTICPGCYPAIAHLLKTYTVSGTQFNGFSQGAAYGDDSQSATNYPLVQITNNKTGHKFFARTHSHSTMAMQTGSAATSTEFDILPTSWGTEFGDSTLVVIANGIPSEPVGIIIEQ